VDVLGKDELVQLVQGAQKGSLEDFQRLYGYFARKILNYLLRMTGSREEAEDLAQDTFVQAFRKLGSIQDPERFRSWLFRIAQNNVYQRFRGKKPIIKSIEEEDEEGLTELEKIEGTAMNPEEAVLSSELRKQVSSAISELPEKYRSVFVLSAVQSLSYQEISEVLHRSMASVKSDIHRARVMVRNRIKAYLGQNHEM